MFIHVISIVYTRDRLTVKDYSMNYRDWKSIWFTSGSSPVVFVWQFGFEEKLLTWAWTFRVWNLFGSLCIFGISNEPTERSSQTSGSLFRKSGVSKGIQFSWRVITSGWVFILILVVCTHLTVTPFRRILRPILFGTIFNTTWIFLILTFFFEFQLVFVQYAAILQFIYFRILPK